MRLVAANKVLKKMMEQARDASPMNVSPLHSEAISSSVTLVRVSPFIGVQGHNTGMGSSLPSQYQERVFAQHAKFGTFEVPRIFLNRANEEKAKATPAVAPRKAVQQAHRVCVHRCIARRATPSALPHRDVWSYLTNYAASAPRGLFIYTHLCPSCTSSHPYIDVVTSCECAGLQDRWHVFR